MQAVTDKTRAGLLQGKTFKSILVLKNGGRSIYNFGVTSVPTDRKNLKGGSRFLLQFYFEFCNLKK